MCRFLTKYNFPVGSIPKLYKHTSVVETASLSNIRNMVIIQPLCPDEELTFSLRLVCMNSGKPRSWAPTSVSSLGGLKPTIPTLYSRQYLSSSSRFHLSICRYLLRFSNTITPYFPLSRFVSTGSDLPDTSTLYLATHKSQQLSNSLHLEKRFCQPNIIVNSVTSNCSCTVSLITHVSHIGTKST